jgi:hypothetical protein
MERLIEQLADEGNIVVEGGKPLGRVRYHLAIYQQFSGIGNERAPLSLKVEGHITPIQNIDLKEFQLHRSELTLRLADGRAVDFLITNADGTIRSTGRGLHGES